MFDIQGIILGLTILFNLFLAGLVVFKDFRNKTNLFFGSFVLSIILWTFAMLMFRVSKESVNYILWLRLSYVAAGFIGITFLFFCLSFIKDKLSGVLWFLIIFVTVLMSILLFQPWFLIHSISYYSWGKGAIEEPLHHLLYSFYFIIFFFGALAVIGDRYRKEIGEERLRLKFIFWGVLLAGSLGTIFNLVLPSPWLNEWRFTWLGPVFTLFFVIFIAIAITKYHLMNIRVIAVELFTVAILVMAGVQIFLSETTIKFALNIVIFLLFLLFGILLIHSALNEVHRREQIEKISQELAAANEKLKELDKAKTDFLSIASHQLRSPLTVIKVGVGALLDGTFGPVKDEKQIFAMNKILENAERLIGLIGDYLNISRIEMGKIQYNFKEMNVCELVKEITEEYKQRAEVKGLKLSFKSAKKIPLAICDDGKIREVITNIIDNSIKYTPKGSVEVKCEYIAGFPIGSGMTVVGGESRGKTSGSSRGLTSADGEIKVSVKDTGLGLDAEEMKIIFQKFRRASDGNMRRREGEPVEGSGLGLFVAKMFLEAHGGKIWVESEGKGKGSNFCFVLPLKPASNPAPVAQEVVAPAQ